MTKKKTRATSREFAGTEVHGNLYLGRRHSRGEQQINAGRKKANNRGIGLAKNKGI